MTSGSGTFAAGESVASPAPSSTMGRSTSASSVFVQQVAALCANARRQVEDDASYFERVLGSRGARVATTDSRGRPPPLSLLCDDDVSHGLPVFRALSPPFAVLDTAVAPPHVRCAESSPAKKTVHFSPELPATCGGRSPSPDGSGIVPVNALGEVSQSGASFIDGGSELARQSGRASPADGAHLAPPRPISAPTLRRRLGLPKAVAEPLQIQIGEDADNTYARLRDAFVGNLDRGTTKVVSVLRLTNESTRSMHAQQQEAPVDGARGDGGDAPSSRHGVVPDFHWFAARNIVIETVAGISNDTFGLAACALRGSSESEQLQLKAFAHQARRGFPVGGFVPADRHPMAIVFEPAIGSEFESAAARDGGLRIKCNLKVLLVGTARRRQQPEQSMAGHTSSVCGRKILQHNTAATYNARVDAEQRHRKEARARRIQEQGHNPHFLRTKPHCAVPYGNSLLVHSCDNLLVSASGWIDMPTDDDALQADSTQPYFTLTRSTGKKRIFPQALKDLLAAKEAAAQRPLRPQKTVHGVKAYPSFVGHDELYFEPQYMVVYEEPEPALDLGELLAELDDCPATAGAKHAGPPKPDAKSATMSSSSEVGVEGKHRPPRKAVDLARVMVHPKDLKKSVHQTFGVMEYTTRWGGQIATVSRSIANDVTVRRWTTFPEDVRTKELSVPSLLDVCGHGSASIDVSNADGVVQYRHSFTFGAPQHAALAALHR